MNFLTRKSCFFLLTRNSVQKPRVEMTTEIGDNGVNISSEEEKRVRDRLEESDEAEIEQKTRNVDKLFPTSLGKMRSRAGEQGWD